jgi:hypothetical protein
VRGAAADETDRHDGGVARRHVAGYHGLQGRDHRSRCGYGIAREMRHGAVPAHALDRDVGHVRRQRDRPLDHEEAADRHARCVVQRVDRIAGEALEQAVLDHCARAAEVFFVGLEDQVERAVEIAALRERLGGRQQDGCVAVMAAGVHAAMGLARIGQARGLDDGERIHVGADAQPPRAAADLELGHDAGLADARVHLVAPFAQQVGDQLAGRAHLEAEFGVGVNLAADVDEGLGVDVGLRQQSGQEPGGLETEFAGHGCGCLLFFDAGRKFQSALRARRLTSAQMLSTPQAIM